MFITIADHIINVAEIRNTNVFKACGTYDLRIYFKGSTSHSDYFCIGTYHDKADFDADFNKIVKACEEYNKMKNK